MRLIPPARLAVLAAAITISACDLGTTDGAGSTAKVSFSLPVRFGSGPTIAAQTVESGDDLDRIDVTIVLKSTGEVVLEKAIGEEEVEGPDNVDPVVTLTFRIPAGGETETFTLTMTGFLGTERRFTIGPVDFKLGADGRTATVEVGAVYVGPGSSVTGVVLSPRSITVTSGQIASFTCVGTPGNVTNFPYEIETENSNVASAQTLTSLRGGIAGTTQLVCRLRFGTHAEDRIPVTVTAGPTITLVSGAGQTGSANSPLANPIVVQVKNGDGTNAVGVPVTFTPNAGHGTTNPGNALTNSSGQASTSWTLGGATGTLTMRASATVAGLPISIDITATVSTAATGSISGSVQTSQGSAISGATVELRSGLNNTSGTPLATTTSASNGSFTFGALAAGSYTVRASATGFTAGSTNATVTAGQTVNATIALAAATGTGGVTGTVTNASNGTAISGATVEIRSGTGVTTGTLAGSSVTQSNGQYTISNLAAGAYTIRVAQSGFAVFTQNVTIVSGQNITVGISLVPTTAAPAVQIVVNWGASPADLDAHLFLPNGSHIFWASQADCAVACLENDVVSGFGPETMRITTVQSGTYFFHVHNFDSCSNPSATPLSASGATVRVYFNGVLQQTFTVPNLPGVNWGVFQLNGTTITPVNSMSPTPPANACTGAPASGGGAKKGAR